jgi:hypothetical protein
MPRRGRMVIAVPLLALVLAPVARADGGPSPGVSFDGKAIRDPTTGRTYATTLAGNGSVLTVREGGTVVRTRTFEPAYGIPLVTYGGAKGGLSRDGKTLVLGQAPTGRTLAKESTLLVLDAATLRTRHIIDLPGDFSFDALSPDGNRLYLIQHTSATDFERYRVRAYDLVHWRLRPGAIVDKTEPNMSGSPVVRLDGPGGAWVYTLYLHQGAEPFVHALDAAHARARCLDVEWRGSQDLLRSSRLALRNHGRVLAVIGERGNRLAAVTLGAAGGGSSIAAWVTGGAAALALAGSAALLSRRRQSVEARRARKAGARF